MSPTRAWVRPTVGRARGVLPIPGRDDRLAALAFLNKGRAEATLTHRTSQAGLGHAVGQESPYIQTLSVRCLLLFCLSLASHDSAGGWGP